MVKALTIGDGFSLAAQLMQYERQNFAHVDEVITSECRDSEVYLYPCFGLNISFILVGVSL